MSRRSGSSTKTVGLRRDSHLVLAAAVPARTGSVRWKVLLFILGVSVSLATLALRPALRSRVAQRTDAVVQSARDALERGELETAADLARHATRRLQRLGRPVGPACLVLGIARARQAEQSDGADRLVYLAAATQHLSEAAKAGVSAADEPGMYYVLAQCLYGRHHVAECVRLLRQTADNYPSARIDSLRHLTAAFLDPSYLDLKQAYDTNLELLQADGLSGDDLVAAWHDRREILNQMGRLDLLSDVEPTQLGDLRWAGTMAVGHDRLMSEDYAAAARAFEQVANLRGLPELVELRTWYLLGFACRGNGATEAAFRAFHEVLWRYPNSPEAHASRAYAAEILLNQAEYDQAITALVQLAEQHEDSHDTHAPAMEAPSMARMLNQAVAKLHEAKRYDQASALVQIYRQYGDESDADAWAAQIYESWALAKREESAGQPLPVASQCLYAAEELFRAAGTVCLRAADSASNTDQSVQWLWRAAGAFAQGRGHLQAVESIERLLDCGVAGELRAKALALLCAELEHSGKADQIPAIAEVCISEFPEHSSAATARFYLARSHLGFGNYEQAEHTLRTALGRISADADHTMIQQMRIVLAHILFDQGREDEAIPRLTEVLESPKGADQNSMFDAKLLLAECLRRRAQRPAARAAESRSELARTHYQLRKEADLDQAIRVFSSLQRELSALSRDDQITDTQAEWLRQCRWSMADSLYEADRVTEAIELYKLLAQAYSDPSDWFRAQLQLANCYVRLNRIDAAVGVMRAAHVKLHELPPDAREQARVGMAPERWKEWLDWVGRM